MTALRVGPILPTGTQVFVRVGLLAHKRVPVSYFAQTRLEQGSDSVVEARAEIETDRRA